jgi:nitrogenase subunit NifH
MKNEFANRVGIWLDNSEAHLIEYNTDVMVSEVIKSKFTHEVMEESLEKSEYTMHNKKRQQQLSYFNEIAEEINNCKELLLFGPTEAKTKLEVLEFLINKLIT